MTTHADIFPRGSEAGRHASPVWRAVRTLLIVATAVGLIAAAGFAGFLSQVPREDPAANVRGDGIVALTGGADRLQDALRLLSSGAGARLLISGVHPGTSENELARAQPNYAPVARCCVDLGRRALNTAGNAVETARWARRHGFRSLVVVTSGYHMPRTLMELAREMPQTELIPYAVVTDRLRENTWWRDWSTVKLMAGEYVKYVAALVRVRLAPRLASNETLAKARANPASACCS